MKPINRDAVKLKALVRELGEALEKAVHIASDENGEVFGGDLIARESAIITWKYEAKKALAKIRSFEESNSLDGLCDKQSAEELRGE